MEELGDCLMNKKLRRRLLMGKHKKMFNGSGFDNCEIIEKNLVTFEGGAAVLPAQAKTKINEQTYGLIDSYPAAYIQLKASAEGYERCVVKYSAKNIGSLEGAYKQKAYAVIISDTETDIKDMAVRTQSPPNPVYVHYNWAEEKGNAEKAEFASENPPEEIEGTFIADIGGFTDVYIAAITAENDVKNGEAGFIKIKELWLEG